MDEDQHLGDLWLFDFESSVWIQVVPADDCTPTSRSYHSMCIDEKSGELFVFGGRSSSGDLNSLYNTTIHVGSDTFSKYATDSSSVIR